MQIVSNIALISINETMVVQLISFLIFLFVINRVMFRPLRNTMQEREHDIEGIRVDIRDAEKKLEKTLQQVQDENAAVRKAGLQMKRYGIKDPHIDAGVTGCRYEGVAIAAYSYRELMVDLAGTYGGQLEHASIGKRG